LGLHQAGIGDQHFLELRSRDNQISVAKGLAGALHPPQNRELFNGVGGSF
jgi:hypothetical protein